MKKVRGDIFKKAREELRKNAGGTRGEPGKPAIGTQEWLAEKAGCSVRLIQKLENNQASLKTIDAVSPYLGLSGRELVFGYGQESVICDAPRVIDFRPTISPHDYPDTFYSTPFMMSIDPLVLNISGDDLHSAELKKITAKISLGAHQITDCIWLYQVLLTPNGNGWLGIEDNVSEIVLANPSKHRASYMFRQRSADSTSWYELVNLIESTDQKLLKIQLDLDFSTFHKELNIGISTTQLGTLFVRGRQKRQSDWPFFAQPDALIWR